MATAQLAAPQTEQQTLVTTALETERKLTPDEFMKLGIERAELIDGKVVKLMGTMLSHDRLVAIIVVLLDSFVEQRRLGMVAAGGTFRTGVNQLRVPDVSFNSTENLEGEDWDSYIQKAPTLAVEIISKNDIYGDVDDKADEFLAAGTKAVWVVNPRHRTVAVHTSDELPMTYRLGDTIPGGEVLPGLELTVAEIFRDATRVSASR